MDWIVLAAGAAGVTTVLALLSRWLGPDVNGHIQADVAAGGGFPGESGGWGGSE